MKIKKIEFIQHPIFQGHSVIFENNGIVPMITFLTGNNGSGKTKILDEINHILQIPMNNIHPYKVVTSVKLSDHEKSQLGVSDNDMEIIIESYPSGGSYMSYKSLTGAINSLDSRLFTHQTKVVYSTVEVNFNSTPINSIGSGNIDEVDNPKEISDNLSAKIPQLLVDISAIDDAELAHWTRQNNGVFPNFIPDSIGKRFQRFINAFHRMYDGEKAYKEKKNSEGRIDLIFTDRNNNELSLKDLSTGEKQIIYRIGFILKNLENMQGGIILIDEPEISLHPKWQIKLKDILHEIFDSYDVQIIIATHSPYIFQKLDDSSEQCIKIDRSSVESKKIQSMSFPRLTVLQNNPSVQLINYLVYGIYNELLHIELYTLLQIKECKHTIDSMEAWLLQNVSDQKNFSRTVRFRNQSIGTLATETLPTFIRNKTHHGDEEGRIYTDEELKKSIDILINLLQRP